MAEPGSDVQKAVHWSRKSCTIKPLFTHIGHSPEEQLIIVERDVPYFSTPFHFHPECELVFIVEGRGKRIVGDSVESFQDGDLVFLGSNIPHVYYSEDIYYRKRSKLRSKAIVIYFNKDIFGPNFYQLNETQSLRNFFHRAERGLRFDQYTNRKLVSLISHMPATKGLERVIRLLEILQLMAVSRHVNTLAGIGYQNTYDTRDNHKIDEVFQYVSQNFDQDISLEKIAALCHLTAPSFCRFFKKRTQKTFVDFLNEFRVSHARKLLAAAEEKNISEIAYECGYRNLSNFNKIFKAKTGVTPKAYKRTLEGENAEA